MQAIWKGAVLAESEETILIEGNHYFPPKSIKPQHFSLSDTHTECHWKGTASYFNVKVDDNINVDAAWFYPDPSEEAKSIAGYVAFWRGVQIVN